MTTLADVSRLLELDNGLCVVSTLRANGTVQSSLVNAGVHELVRHVGLLDRGRAPCEGEDR